MLEEAGSEAVFEVDGVLDLDQRRLVRIAGRVRKSQHAGKPILLGVVVVLGVDLQPEFVQWFAGENWVAKTSRQLFCCLIQLLRMRG